MTSSRDPGEAQPRRQLSTLTAVLLAVFILVNLVQLLREPRFSEQSARPIAYSQLLIEADAGRVRLVTIEGRQAFVVHADGTRSTVDLPPQTSPVADRLSAAGATVEIEPVSDVGLSGVLLAVLPPLVLVGVMLCFMSRAGGAFGRITGMGKSRARAIRPGEIATTFADVAGVDEVKADLQEIVDYLTEPERFVGLGAELPRGVLLVGSPGVGKTLLARAVAGEAAVPFLAISGSDFVEMFVGVGAARVRDMFDEARKQAPCIVFIDEIDAIGRRRGASAHHGNDEREQALNQILVEMDGFDPSGGIVVLAATNRPEILDPALVRPGRFDRQVFVADPDMRARRQILDVHARAMRLAAEVDLDAVAGATAGFTGAALKNLLNEAALAAGRRRDPEVTPAHIDQAVDRLVLGRRRELLIVGADERRIVAVHEAGHALVAMLVPDRDPIRKVTILPHGAALGAVARQPDGDRLFLSKRRLLGDLAVAMAGRAAEELEFGPDQVTAGAADDIAAATRLARRMVVEWGMDEKVGMVLVADGPDGDAPAVRAMAEQRVACVLGDAYERARNLLASHRDAHAALVEALLAREQLAGDEVELVVAPLLAASAGREGA